MSRDNWERLVTAVIRKQQLWELFHQHSRSPSVLSEASDFSSFHDDFSSPGSSSTYWKQREDTVVKSKLVFISDFIPAFNVEDVFLAFTELLRRGTFGSTYTAALGNGVRIVVKRLNRSVPEPKFKRHMDIVGNIRHENVAPLRAYYSSKDESLMLYDYYSNGNVHELLHGENGENQASLDWETRLRIAIGAARGLAEIHRQNGGKLVHGNIKSTNIILNPQNYGCVSDLGLANMIATTFMPTAWCYAPEVKNFESVSQESDVYSFGILLLELLTRKSPVHIPGGPVAVNLVKLVNSIKSKVGAFSVFDAELLKHPTIREQMVKVLQIGISCIAKSIQQRPKMSEVVNMLEDLSEMNTGSGVSLEQKLIFVEDGNPAFELEDVLRASAEVLGRGTFGTSYKAIFQNGDAIVVKRLKDVNVTFEEFQQHMEIIGRIRHKNVAGLRAYHYSRELNLVVYDYYDQESVSALLHGPNKIPLDWETRLKIAVGAARGIAHIHKQDNQNLVHGNIKSSNIYLNTQKYGIVSDTGHAKLTMSIKRSLIPTLGHFAPEVKDTRNTTQACDVYSFGVVLLELISRRPPHRTMEDGKVISLVDWIHSVIREEWTAGVFDLELLRHQKDDEAMVRVLQIAMDCVAIGPEDRPKMIEVVKMLEEISGVDDMVDEPSIESRFEDLLEDLLVCGGRVTSADFFLR